MSLSNVKNDVQSVVGAVVRISVLNVCEAHKHFDKMECKSILFVRN